MSDAATRPAADGDPFASYALPQGRWDEAMDSVGVRQSWRGLWDHLKRGGHAGFAKRHDQVARLLRENGVTYAAHKEGGAERPWSLDPLPVLIPAAEWSALSRGVAQRARLASLVLEDLYGPQRLLRDGMVHPNAVFNHPSFLRPLHGVPMPCAAGTGAPAPRLTLYAVDLVRGPDGRFQVLAEHTQAPAGMGYLLENRIITSRVLPEPFKQLRVERLAQTYMTLLGSLRALSPNTREHPRAVVLTPGPYSETYFEHAYLARYLNLTLVEGADLTVRDQKVYLKTLGGLHRVDVILRRLADDYCDPLELRSESILGTAGLVGAVRAGSVLIANGLGSGVCENGALLRNQSALARHLLGEELRLPAVRTLWGGQDQESLLADFDRLAIRPAFTSRAPATIPSRLPAAERDALMAKVLLDPTAWVGQAAPDASTCPVWTVHGLAARPVALRLYAVADPRHVDGFVVLPGGLARVGEAADAHPFAWERSRSKDVWVLAEGPVSQVSLLAPATGPVVLKRGGVDLPSRVADNLYWVGRYAERAEWIARLVRDAARRLAEDPVGGGGPALPAVLAFLTQLGLRNGTGRAGTEVEALTRELSGILTDPAWPGGLQDSLAALRRAAFAVRDRLSNDTWRTINRLGISEPASLDEVQAALDRLLTDLAALAGLGNESMTRGPAWRFLDLGRRIERAQVMGDLLRATWEGRPGDPRWLEALLEVGDSGMTYRGRYLTNLQPAAVLDLLLVDPTNPRSVAFQLGRVSEHIKELPREQERALPEDDERLARRLPLAVELADPEDLAGSDGRAERVRLLDKVAKDLLDLSEVVTRIYLSHAAPRPHMAP